MGSKPSWTAGSSNFYITDEFHLVHLNTNVDFWKQVLYFSALSANNYIEIQTSHLTETNNELWPVMALVILIRCLIITTKTPAEL